MIRVFLPSQRVPEWLIKQVPQPGAEESFQPAKITFGDLCLAYGWKRAYYIIGLAGFGPTITIRDGFNFVVCFRPAGGSGKGAVIYPAPRHTWALFALVVVSAIAGGWI